MQIKKRSVTSLIVLLVGVLFCVFLAINEVHAYVPIVSPMNIAPGLLLNPTLAADLAKCTIPSVGGVIGLDPTVYGLTVGTVYCIKKYLYVAVTLYTQGLAASHYILVYQFACYSLALAFFGVRVMTLQSKSLIKDSMLLIIKLCIAIYLTQQSATIFTTFSNGIGEMMGWMTTFFNLGAAPSSCLPLGLLEGALTTADPTVNYDEYRVWHMVDCFLLRMFGISFTLPVVGTVPGTERFIFASLIPIIATALFTSSIGFTTAALGIFLVATIIKMILKGMYLVLLTYFLLAIFAIFTPLFAPLLVFESHNDTSYTRQIFDRWYKQLFTALLQPVVMTAYLGFAMLCIDAFIEGDISSNPQIRAVFDPGCTPGLQGGSICTFNQLFKTQNQVLGNTFAMTGDFSYMTKYNPTLANWKIVGDPQTASSDCSAFDRRLSYITNTVAERVNQVASKAISFSMPGPATLEVNYIRFLQLTLTFICALIVTVTLYNLMDTIPALAQSIAGGIGGGIFGAIKVPLEGITGRALSGSADALRNEANTKGLFAGGGLSGLMGVPASTFKGVKGATDQFIRSITGRPN